MDIDIFDCGLCLLGCLRRITKKIVIQEFDGKDPFRGN